MKSITVTILAVLAFSRLANATPLEVLFETHHVYGRSGNEKIEEYDETSFYSPVTGSATGKSKIHEQIYELSAESYAGNFTVGTYTQLEYCQSIAESSYIFQPQSDGIRLSLNSTYSGDSLSWQYNSVILTNLNVKEVLLNYHTGPDGYWPPDGDYTPFETGFDFDFVFNFKTSLSDVYMLTLYSFSIGSDEGNTRTSLTANIDVKPAPEPATIILFGLGFAGLLLRKKQ